MAQGVCDKVSSESLCTSLVKDKEVHGQERFVISALVWQFTFEIASVWICSGKQVHQPVLGCSPWVGLRGPYKRSLHHSAVIVVTTIDLLWSLR